MVSGWYSNKGNPNTRYGLFTGATDGLENEQLVYCQKFMKPNAKIPSTNLGLIYIKIRHCDYDLIYEHEYRNWNDDICIGWLRPGNLGGETVNWFFNGKTDCWYYGGNKGEPLVVSHRVICGNIPPSDTSTDTGSEEDNGQYIKPDSEEDTSASGGHYVRPGSEEKTPLLPVDIMYDQVLKKTPLLPVDIMYDQVLKKTPLLPVDIMYDQVLKETLLPQTDFTLLGKEPF